MIHTRQLSRWLPIIFLLSTSISGSACRRAQPPPAPPVVSTIVDATPPPSVAAVAPPAVVPAGDETLMAEERDPDPRSATVTIKVIVDQRRKAHVFWGRKDLGEAPLELQRPRDSGPVDLLIVAPGYLPLHTRAFTDRDDKLFLRLFSAQEAPQMLGYAPTESERSPRRTP